MIINEAPKNLLNIKQGAYRLTDKQYFSPELESICDSQSNWKHIRTKSYKQIQDDKKNFKPTKATRIGNGLHYLGLEGQKVFDDSVFIKRKFEEFPTRKDWIRDKLEQSVIPIGEEDLAVSRKHFFGERLDASEYEIPIKLPTLSSFVKKGMHGIKKPKEIKTQAQYIAKAKTTKQKENLKEKHRIIKKVYRKQKHLYDDALRVVTSQWKLEENKANKILEKNQGINDAIEIEWNQKNIIFQQIVNEWREKKNDYEFEKKVYKRELEIAIAYKQVILSEDEVETIKMGHRAILNHNASLELISRSETEITFIVFHALSGLRLKCKIDILDQENGILGDLKFLDKIDKYSFYSACEYGFLYKIQFAIYTWAAEALGMVVKKFVAITPNKNCEEVAYINIPLSLIKGRWLDEANELLCDYAKAKTENKKGKGRFDGEVNYYDPNENDIDDLDKVLKMIAERKLSDEQSNNENEDETDIG